MEGIITQGARSGPRIRQIPTRDRAGQRAANDDLAALAGGDRLAQWRDQSDIEPGHGMADGADRAVIIVGRDARAFGHAIAFADLHAEPPFEGDPDFARTAPAPCDARAMRPVERRWRLLQEDLQYP